MNKLLGQKIVITSYKPQTTRKRVLGILNSEDFQAVFVDTPGIHTPRNELHRRIVNYAYKTITDSDLIFFITEPFGPRQENILPEDRIILEKISQSGTNTILLINKIDLCGEEALLKTISVLNQEFDFAETVPVSAMTGKGVDFLFKILKKYLPKGESLFHPDQITDMSEREIVGEFIREQIFRRIEQEIPYGVAVIVEEFQEMEDIVHIFAMIYVEKNSHKGIIIGNKGSMIKKIGTHAREKIEHLLGKKVFLRLNVKVVKDWMNNPSQLKNLGYEKMS